MSWKDESVKRIMKTVKLQQDCSKHLEIGGDALAGQILLALLKATSQRNEPVKLSEIADGVYGKAEKDKQDIVRLTMDKTLIRCGIVDKIYFSDRDVRFFPTGYRFQEVRRVETAARAKIDELVGDVVELPRAYWPVPRQYFELLTAKTGIEASLAKLEEDAQNGLVPPRSRKQLRSVMKGRLDDVERKLKDYEELSRLIH